MNYLSLLVGIRLDPGACKVKILYAIVRVTTVFGQAGILHSHNVLHSNKYNFCNYLSEVK